MFAKNNSSWVFLEPLCRVSAGSRLVRWWQRIIVLLFDKQKWERAKKNIYWFPFDSREIDFSQTQQTKKSQNASGSHFKAVLLSEILTLCDQMHWDIKKNKREREKWEKIIFRVNSYICTQSDTLKYDSDGSFISFLTFISNWHVFTWSSLKHIQIASLFPQPGK